MNWFIDCEVSVSSRLWFQGGCFCGLAHYEPQSHIFIHAKKCNVSSHWLLENASCLWGRVIHSQIQIRKNNAMQTEQFHRFPPKGYWRSLPESRPTSYIFLHISTKLAAAVCNVCVGSEPILTMELAITGWNVGDQRALI